MLQASSTAREKMSEGAIREAARVIQQADALFITAGAGMGVDSGLPDFRGDEGFWRAYPPFKARGLTFVDMANPSWFERNPAVAWGFYGHRLALYRQTLPHEGFRILRRWAENMRFGAFVFTSNVDGQFQRAGFSEDAIVECHGSIHHFQCTVPCHEQIWEADAPITVDPSTFEASEPLPRCPRCGKLARPNVLMFGDWNWIADRTSAQERRWDEWLEEQRSASLAIVEMGAGSAVPTVRRTSEQIGRRKGATLIRINPREPEVPSGHLGIAGSAKAILQQIEECMRA